ncbi:methyltransferase domain-containing protein [Lederbergia citrea]|uniref:Methyltransferase domain-containing protein n=1 Tax=Lederbergia citrea TaxID=2833581 RepID=A0A942USV9_9BACI|nr:methyltransferase domain-containing protein [Lederbergia citrea]
MKKPLDRITEAYFGDMGDAFAEKVRDRIHWVCENAKGESILDVGCSQGITSILLGREGKMVLGIDLLQEAIDFANQRLENEEEITKQYVEFKAANFMSMNIDGQGYDSIIFGEVLEHITDPQRFIRKATSLLNENGSIIVTLPFGINDYFDHKKTYYLSDLLKFQDSNISIHEIKFFGKWIGAIFKKKDENSKELTINDGLVNQLEGTFYTIERDLLQKARNNAEAHKNLEEEIDVLLHEKKNDESLSNEKLANKNAEITQLSKQLLTKDAQIEELNEKCKKMDQEISDLTKQKNIAIENAELNALNLEKQYQEKLQAKNSEITALNDQVAELKKEAILANKEKVNIQRSLIEAHEKEENLLISYQNLLKRDNVSSKVKQEIEMKDRKIKQLKDNEKALNNRINMIEKYAILAKKEKINVQEELYKAYEKEERLLGTYQRLLKKYKALSESKLGQITLAYWRKRSRKRVGGK